MTLVILLENKHEKYYLSGKESFHVKQVHCVYAAAFQGNPRQLRTGRLTEKWIGKDI